MPIYIAEWKLPKIHHTIEVSNPEEFLKAAKELNRKYHVRRPTKVRALGGGKIPADIQRLIDKTDEPDTPGGAIAEAITTPEERAEVQKNREKAIAETTKDLRTPVGDGLAVKPLGHTPPEEQKKPKRIAKRARPGGTL